MKKAYIISVIFISILILSFLGILYFLRIIPPFASTSDTITNSENFTLPEDLKFEIQAENLEIPWAIAFVGENKFLVTERTGKIKVVDNKEVLPEPAIDLTDQIFVQGEAGLMSMVTDPEFPKQPFVYTYHTYTAEDENNALKVVRYKFAENKLVEPFVVIQRIPMGNVHSGGEIAFGPDGKLYITTGDTAEAELAQDLSVLAGKTLRINKDGSIPVDNPFVERVEENGHIECDDSRCEVWSLGHRNAQGLDWHPVTQEMYQSEHGPSGFDGGTGMDEINLIRRGLNYGWPTIRGEEEKVGMESPLKLYTPAIAPASVQFYNGEMFSEFKNTLFVAALRGESIVMLDVNGKEIKELGKLVSDQYGRIREIQIAPDGSIYFTTSNRDGRGDVRNGDDKVVRVYR